MRCGSSRGSASSTSSSARARRRRRPPPARRAGNALLNSLASYLTEPADSGSDVGLPRRAPECLREFIHLLPNGFSTPTTTTLAFIKAGYNVAFEPIDARQRSGHSKIRFARDGAQVLADPAEDRDALQPAAHLPADQRASSFVAGAIYGIWNMMTQRARFPTAR